MSSACSIVDRDDLENCSISELVSILRTAFRAEDFDKLEEVLIAKEVKLKRELEKKNNEAQFKNDSNQFVQWRETSEKLKEKEAEVQVLKQLVVNVNEERKTAHKKEKLASARFEKLLEEAKRTAQNDKQTIEELHSRNSELELSKSAVELEVEVWKNKYEELEHQVSQLEVSYTSLENGDVVGFDNIGSESGACSARSREIFGKKGPAKNRIRNKKDSTVSALKKGKRGKRKRRSFENQATQEGNAPVHDPEQPDAADHNQKKRKKNKRMEKDNGEQGGIMDHDTQTGHGAGTSKTKEQRTRMKKSERIAGGTSRSVEEAIHSDNDQVSFAMLKLSSSSGLNRSKRAKRGTRGVTALRELSRIREGERMLVHYNIEGQPIGPNAKKMQSYIGVCVRNQIPITYPSWKDVPQDLKDKIFECIEMTFIVDPRAKHHILQSASIKFRSFKCFLTQKYILPFKDQPNLLSAPPKLYSYINEAHWEAFVQARLSEEFEEISRIHKQMRAKNIFNHRISRKGYANLAVELELSGEKYSREILWKAAQKGNKEDYGDELTRQCASVMDSLMKEKTQSDVLSEALGTPERTGRVRGVGAYVTPTSYFRRVKPSSVSNTSSLRQTNSKHTPLDAESCMIPQANASSDTS